MRFNFELVGAGWARAEVSGDSGDATLTASYLGDALGDLLEAIAAMLEGADSAICHWEEEPGEYRWKFHREADRVEIVILALPDNYPRQPDDSGDEVFRTNDSLATVASIIADGAQRLLGKWGEVGYLERWIEAPFPAAQLQRVRTALGAG